MKSLEELAAEGFRGQALADAIYEDTFGVKPVPEAERTAEFRRAALERFFAIMDSMTEEELAEGNPLADRPTNTSILLDDGSPDANAA